MDDTNNSMDLTGLATPTVPVPGGDPGPGSLTPPTPTAVPGPGKAPLAAGPNNKPGSHAGLIGMLQGLAVATSAFGRAAATGGREGGARDVLAYQDDLRQQKRAAEDQQMKKADFDTRQKYMQAQTNALIVKTQTD